MSDETYPDSLPFEVLDVIGRTVAMKNAATTWASAAANALDEARRLGHTLVPVPDGMTVEEAASILDQHKPDPDAELRRAIESYDLCGDTAIDAAAFLDELRAKGFDVVRRESEVTA